MTRLLLGPKVEWDRGGVRVDGELLSEAEAAPYWSALGINREEFARGGGRVGTNVRMRIASIDYEKKIVTYGPEE